MSHSLWRWGVAVLALLSLLSMSVSAHATGLFHPHTVTCGTWNVVPSLNVGTSHNYLNAVDAASPNNAWAVGYYATGGSPLYQKLIELWDGTEWTISYAPNPINADSTFLYGVDALSTTEAWAVGTYSNTQVGTFQTLIEQGTRGHWHVIPSPNVGTGINVLNAITHVPGMHQLWAVGDEVDSTGIRQTLIESWNGTTWSIVPSPNIGTDNNRLLGVTAISPKDAWAVGYTYSVSGNAPFQNIIEHWNGTTWNLVTSPTDQGSHVLNGTTRIPGTDQLWAVGQDNTGNNDIQTRTYHHQGKTWALVPSPNVSPGGPNTVSVLNGVTAISASDVWAVGDSQAVISSSPTLTLIEQWNGSQWSIVASPSPDGNDDLLGVAPVPHSSQAWAVGYSYNGSVAQTLIEEYC